MLKTFFFSIAILWSLSSFAQKTDSIFVSHDDKGWVIRHKVKPKETVLSLARRFHVPPAMVADMNSVTYQQQLTANSKVYIPLGAYNLLTAKPLNTQETRPIYRKVGDDESLYSIARATGVSQRTIQKWNNLDYIELHKGQILLVGWVLYDNTSLTKPQKEQVAKTEPPVVKPSESSIKVTMHVPDTIYYNPNDTLALADTMLSEGAQLFNQQTFDGSSVTEEKGTAAFFKGGGFSSNGIYFAFHNTAKRGTIIKIYNPGTGKTVYAKVIGPLPVREIFHNAIIGISNDAKAELEVPGQKMWAEISYAP
jgi:LysM repeat protein